MSPAGETLRERLDLLVAGITEPAPRRPLPRTEPRRHRRRLHQLRQLGMAAGRRPLRAGPRLWQYTGDDAHRAHGRGLVRAPRRSAACRRSTSTPPRRCWRCRMLWKDTRDPRWAPVLDDWADRLMTEAAAHRGGGFQHDRLRQDQRPASCGTTRCSWSACSWRATAQASGRPELVDEAARQFLVHAHYLADRETGLWFHGWTFDGRHNFARARWARGNAWITVGILDLMDLAAIARAVRDFLYGCLRAPDRGAAAPADAVRRAGARCSTTRPPTRRSPRPPASATAC